MVGHLPIFFKSIFTVHSPPTPVLHSFGQLSPRQICPVEASAEDRKGSQGFVSLVLCGEVCVSAWFPDVNRHVAAIALAWLC